MNVLLIVVDSLRADALRDAGHTPFFASLAQRGLWYRRAYATECWTLPTHASLFTGLLPSQHGAHFRHMALAPGPRTAAEDLAARGYYTELVTRNFVFDGTIPGITRGFQACTRPLASLQHSGVLTSLLVLAKPRIRRHVRATGFFHPRHAEQRAFVRRFARTLLPADGLTLAHALEVMRRCRRVTQPFFVCCNLYDVHAPYAPTAYSLWEPWGSAHGLAGNLGFPYYMAKLGQHAYLRDGFALPDWARRTLSRRYAQAVARMDAQLADFTATAASERLLDDTLIVITSDHGEAFGEHGLYLHDASVYDTHVHVPLWVGHPQRAAAVVDDVVSTRDLYAVLASAAGAASERETLLDPSWRAAHPFAYAEHWHSSRLPAMAHRYRQDLRAVMLGEHKIVSGRAGLAVFDRRRDPNETDPLPIDASAALRLCRKAGLTVVQADAVLHHLGASRVVPALPVLA